VVTRPAELARLAHAKQQENLAFRRFVKDHHVNPELLRVIGAEITAAIDCTTCAACCRHLRVAVDAEDILGIAAFLKLRPAEVRRMYTEPDPAGGPPLLAQPAGECVFLDHNLCLIYDARPPACRLFPYLTPHETSLGARAESIWRRDWFCPIVFNSIEEFKHRAGFHPHSGR
jgi:hypothetical protein